MKALLVENDATHAETIAKRLTKSCGITAVDRITTELEFSRRLEELVAADYAIAVFDVMIPWCKIGDLDKADAERPPEVQAEHVGQGRKRGGLRCQRLLAGALARAGKPPMRAMLYTVLESYDLAEELTGDVVLLVKHGDENEFVRCVRELLSKPPPARAS